MSANGWQPIETAPKDGTWMLIWRKDYVRPVVDRWYPPWGRWVIDEREPDVEGAVWMPLPPPPSEAQP